MTMVGFIALIVFVLIEYVYLQLYNDAIQRILDKKKGWVNRLLLAVLVLVYVTTLYTWLPHKLGFQITLMDGEIPIEGGAIYTNLTIMFGATAVAIVLGLLGHIWRAMRRKVKFNGKFFLLEVLFIAAFVFAATRFIERADIILEYPPETDTKYIAAFILVGIFLIVRIKKRLAEPY